MQRKYKVIFVISILVSVCVSCLCTMAIVTNDVNKRIHQAVESETSYYKELLFGLDTFLEVKNQVDGVFVDEVNYDLVEEKLIEEYIKQIGDKYADYYSKEELSAYLEKLSGSFVGVGIACAKVDGKIYVTEVIEGSPANKAKIKKGETIIAVDGVYITEENYDEVIDSVLGEEGTEVIFTVIGEDKKERTVSVKREKIAQKTVESKMLEGKIAYVKITRFASNTDEAFSREVDKLLEEGAVGFLFDVRNNPGGELGSVVNVLDRLLPKGPLVNIFDGDGNKETKYSTDEQSVDLPMAVLINEKTASAAELFTAALRDHEKAQIYGKKSYGKGYMQRIFQLSDGSGVKISFAKYNPPYGENYEGKGILPHVEAEDDFNTENDEQLEKALTFFDGLN